MGESIDLGRQALEPFDDERPRSISGRFPGFLEPSDDILDMGGWMVSARCRVRELPRDLVGLARPIQGREVFSADRVSGDGSIDQRGDNATMPHQPHDSVKTHASVEQRRRERVTEAMKFKRTVLQSPESMMREPSAPADDPALSGGDRDLASHPEIQAKIHEMMQKHWDRWIHEKIPALGHRTPLEAVQNPDGREMVEALLLEYERNNELKNLADYPADLHSIRCGSGSAETSSTPVPRIDQPPISG